VIYIIIERIPLSTVWLEERLSPVYALTRVSKSGDMFLLSDNDYKIARWQK
jgi:sulfur relay (sulfurtransferase) DsrF/TusC family protein